MASALLENLSAASTLAASDLFYVKQAGARGLKATGTQLLTLVGTTYVPLAGNATMTGALTLPAGAVGAPSLMFTGAGATTGFYSAGSNNVSLAVNGSQVFSANDGIIWAEGVTGLGIVNALFIGGAGDLRLQRDAAATLAQRNGTTQQIFRLYNSYTDSSNFERLTLTGMAGTSVNITAETLGTGGDNLDIVLTPAGTGTVKTAVFAAQVVYAGVPGVTVPVVLSYNGNIGLNMGDTSRVSWSSNSEGQTAADTALFRGAAGQVDVTNGTAGTWRDLKLRNLLSTGYAQIDSGTLTASAPALNVTQTWNSGATVFTALKVNVTNTASDSASLLQDWQVGGVSAAALLSNGTFTSSAGSVFAGSVFAYAVRTNLAFYWEQGDLALYRDAAATLAQRNGTTQQIFRLYNTYTDASNYERLTLTGVAGTSVNLTAETMGTGADNIDIVLTPAGTGVIKIGALDSGANFLRENVSGFGYGMGYYSSGIVLGKNADPAMWIKQAEVRIASTVPVAWASSGWSGSIDTAFHRGAAGQVDVTNGTAGTYRDLKLRNLLNTEYHQMTEMTAPAAPATNSVRIYAEDNGAGKTRLMALFATGSAVQIAIEP